MSYHLARLKAWWHCFVTGHTRSTYRFAVSERLDFIGCQEPSCKRVFWLSIAASERLVTNYFSDRGRA